MAADRGCFRFGDYLLDPEEARLLRSGAPVHLEPKALQVLGVLAASPGHLVAKRELLDAVWPETFVTENALTRSVARLRGALGDDPHEPRYIETVPTVGYRFVAAVEVVEPGATPGKSGPAPLLERQAENRGSAAPGARAFGAVLGLLLLALAALGAWRLALAPEAPPADPVTPGRPMIVVLPFENLGPPEDAYFASGMTEEITTRLAAVAAIGVISRKSADLYAGSDKTIRQIGEELGVDYVLGGSVRWDRGTGARQRVRISPQLIRVADDNYLWADSYDRMLDDVFAVQTEIAREVLRQLGVAVLDPVDAAALAPPTRNMDAYNAYLRGLARFAPPFPTEEEIALAAEMFARATELDPEFALAWAWLSTARSMLHWLYGPSEEQVRRAEEAAERALELDPELPQARAALAVYHLYGRRDYARAAEEAEAALKVLPNDDAIIGGLGVIRRRQGRFAEALTLLERAFELNPRSARYALFLGWSHAAERRYDAADRWYDRSISLAPDQGRAYRDRARNYWLWRGDTEAARAALQTMPVQGGPESTGTWFFQELYERDYEAASERLAGTPGELVGHRPKALLEGWALDLLGESEKAIASYERARQALERSLAESPADADLHNAFTHSRLSLALAGLGRAEAAVREGQRGAELLPISEDAFSGPYIVLDQALIDTMVGRHDAALERLEYLLSIPAGRQISVPLLELDPRWDPLRSHRRYRRIVEQPAVDGH
ncbi:MAG: tetratricopeptide repeat protein [bacterium]|nr:tetratricopeptide repeat protein [bacterium]